MDTLEGIDTSNLNGSPLHYEQTWWYQQAKFVIAQAIPRGPASTADQLYNATAWGKHPGAYSWYWDDPSWRLDPDLRTDQRLRWATVPTDALLEMRPWVDGEDNQSPAGKARSIPLRVRKDNVLIALEVADNFANGRGLPPGGLYTSEYYINYLWDGWVPEGRVLWLANYSAPAGSLIGTRNGAVVGHQYTSSPIDRDIILASEIFRQDTTSTMTLRVNEGLAKAMSDNNDRPITDEFTEFVNSDGTVVQAALGMKGRYRSTNANGDWQTAGPLGS